MAGRPAGLVVEEGQAGGCSQQRLAVAEVQVQTLWGGHLHEGEEVGRSLVARLVQVGLAEEEVALDQAGLAVERGLAAEMVFV